MEGEGGWVNGNSIHFIKLTALPDTPPSPPPFNFTVVTSTGDSVHLQSQSPGGTAGVTRGTDEQRWGGGDEGGTRLQQIYFYGMKASLVSPPVIVFPLCCLMETGGGGVEVAVVAGG